MNAREQVKKAAFLAAYAECGIIGEAAKIAGISRTTHYNWLEADKSGEYKKAFEAAGEQAVDLLEKEARRRAYEGVDEPVFHKGEVCGRIRRYSDTLLIFLLKGARPEKYRENVKTELTGPNGGPAVVRLEGEVDKWAK